MAPKQKINSISKSQANFEKIDISPIFVTEEILYQFMICVHKEADLYNIFKNYIEYVQEQDFEITQNVEAPPVLREDITFTLNEVAYDVSEAAICENLIYPILKTAWRRYSDILVAGEKS